MGTLAIIGAIAGVGSVRGDSTPGGVESALLLEDGTFGLLLEDGTSYLLLEG